MSDQLDDTLEGLARVDAPADFARRVRVRLEAGMAPPLWPRLAAVAAAVLLVVSGTWIVTSIERRDGSEGVAEAPRAQVEMAQVEREVRAGETPMGGAEAPPAQAPRAARPPVRAGRPPVRAGRTAVRAGRASALPISPTAVDHEQALPALAQLDSIGTDSLVTVPMTIDAREVAALTAIAPIDIPALRADEGERR